MVRIDKNTGNLIIEIEVDEYRNPVEELECRRQAIFNAIVGMQDDFKLNNEFYYLILLLQDLEPTFEQWEKMTA